MFDMKWKIKKQIEHGHYQPLSKRESADCTRAMCPHDQPSSTVSTSHNPAYLFSNSERTTFEAYQVQVAEGKTRAIETARRTTFL